MQLVGGQAVEDGPHVRACERCGVRGQHPSPALDVLHELQRRVERDERYRRQLATNMAIGRQLHRHTVPAGVAGRVMIHVL
eukprot:COSAG04_NODE_958_length_9164_cov_27.103916_3_plen_81_part_00